MDDAILRDICMHGLAIKDQCFVLALHILSAYIRAVVIWCRFMIFGLL